MYNFMYSGEFWMESIVTGCIAAGATIIGAIIMYQFSLHKILDNTNQLVGDINERKKDKMFLTEEHHDLSKEHSGLSKEHVNLSKEHSSILDKVERTESVIFSMREQQVVESNNQKHRYESLSDKQKSLHESLVSMPEFIKEFGEMSLKLKDLQHQNDILLKQRSSYRESEIHFTQSNKEMALTIENLKEKLESQQRIINKLTTEMQKKSITKNHELEDENDLEY